MLCLVLGGEYAAAIEHNPIEGLCNKQSSQRVKAVALGVVATIAMNFVTIELVMMQILLLFVVWLGF